MPFLSIVLSTVGRNKREEIEAFKDLAVWLERQDKQSEPSKGLSKQQANMSLSKQCRGNTGSTEHKSKLVCVVEEEGER